MAMMIANILGGVNCLIIGLVLRTGKANFLMAGYNTMSKAEQQKWNANEISSFTGRMLITASAVLLLACIPIALDVFALASLFVSWVLFTVGILAGSIYMNKSPRFKRIL